MAVQSERRAHRASSSRNPRKRQHPHAPNPDVQPTPAPADKKSARSLCRYVGALLGKLSISLGILLFLICLVLWLFTGYILNKIHPEYMVTIQPFEISSEVDNHSSLSGKSASDIAVDILNDAASHAAQFHGTDYYKYVGAGAQPVSLHQAIKVPIQTSYGIELKGISVDSILHLYDRARYDQWIIGGDVISSPKGLVGRIRLNNADTAKSWETPPSAHADPAEVVRAAVYLMLKSAHPELLGQSYLQQAKYDAAEEVFREWAIADPRNWKPSYYLSLVYSYQNKGQEASSLASWSQLLHDDAHSISRRGRKSTGSGKEIASNLAQTTKVALETRDTPETQNTLVSLHNRLDTLEGAKSRLDTLFKSKPTYVDYRIQRARILDKEALIESDLDRNSPKAYQWSKEAVDGLYAAIQSVPENAGLHEQRAILLMHLVTIMKTQGKGSQEIRDKEIEEAKEYTRALELRPEEDSPLWGAVYAQIDLGNGEAAVDLARTIALLEPGCTAANAAYLVALERTIKFPGHEPEKEKEVGERLQGLLKSNPEESELLAVLDAFLTNDDHKHADLLVAEGKRRFPGDSAFAERKIHNYLAGLLHSDGQLGS
jgi:tetratricopeptide (TPR) repeat protein